MYSDSYSGFGMELLGHGNYIAVNRTLIRRIGLNAAVIIGELSDKARMFDKEGQLKDGWFYMKVKTLGENTGLGERAQKSAIDDLVRIGVLEVEYMGLPKRRWFRINFHRLMDILSGVEIETTKKIRAPEPEPEEQESATLFDAMEYFDPSAIPTKQPTKAELEKEVREEQVTEVLVYLNSRTGANYSTLRNDNRMNIRARLREGYTVEQCKTVIDKKTRRWLGTQFAENLNPATLFDKTKFDIYLQQPDTVGVRNGSDDDWKGGW